MDHGIDQFQSNCQHLNWGQFASRREFHHIHDGYSPFQSKCIDLVSGRYIILVFVHADGRMDSSSIKYPRHADFCSTTSHLHHECTANHDSIGFDGWRDLEFSPSDAPNHLVSTTATRMDHPHGVIVLFLSPRGVTSHTDMEY